MRGSGGGDSGGVAMVVRFGCADTERIQTGYNLGYVGVAQ